MKRFYRNASAAAADGGWRVELDDRAVKTQGGRAQLLPSEALAAAMVREWQGQPDELDLTRFVLRDLADFAIDTVAIDPAETLRALLPYAETDTLCYRAEPGDALLARQDDVWEPLLHRAETTWNLRFVRVAGIIHQPQPPETLHRIAELLTGYDPFTLAALRTTASLAASLVIGLLALEPGADAAALWDAANLEEDWQAERWGSDAEALALRTKRGAAFGDAVRFARLARGDE